MDLIYTTTEDKLILPGAYYSSSEKDLCVVFVHGMAGTILENQFANVLGKVLQQNDINFLYGHNRGSGHISDFIVADQPISDEQKDIVGLAQHMKGSRKAFLTSTPGLNQRLIWDIQKLF